MKRLAVVLAVAAGLVAPSVADAHTATVAIDCYSGKVVASYAYASFPNSYNTAQQTISETGQVLGQQTASGYGNNLKPTALTITQPADNQSHTYTAKTWWSADGGGSASKTWTCPAIKPPPTPTPTPSPTPTPTPPAPPVTPPTPPVPPVDCMGKPLVPGVAASDCTPKPPKKVKKCPDTRNRRYKIVPTPKHLSHGLQHFHLRGPYIRSVRWYIDMHRVGNSRWTHLSDHTKTFSAWLFDQKTWGHDLWGWHWVTVQAKVGPKGCGHTTSVRLHFFNNDPVL